MHVEKRTVMIVLPDVTCDIPVQMKGAWGWKEGETYWKQKLEILSKTGILKNGKENRDRDFLLPGMILETSVCVTISTILKLV